MNQSLEETYDQHSKCTEVEMMQAGRTDCLWLRWSHPIQMSCTKHHEDITIATLAENYPKTIHNMAPFEFANTVANSTGVQGLSANLHYMHFERTD